MSIAIFKYSYSITFKHASLDAQCKQDVKNKYEGEHPVTKQIEAFQIDASKVMLICGRSFGGKQDGPN